MDQFSELLIKAKERRDATIAKARREYKQAIDHIKALRKVMGVPAPQKWRAVAGQTPTLRDAMLAALDGRTMTKIELAVAVREAGYTSRMPQREFVRKMAKILRTDARFRRDGERWMVTRRHHLRQANPPTSQ